jgi:hypothetical protein
VQTVDHGVRGKPEAGDEVVLTFGGVVNPDLILSGWDGSTTPITVKIDASSGEDWLTFRDQADSSFLLGLGGVELGGDYADGATFANSQMTLTGSTVTIVLGTASGTIFRDPSAKNMVWWTSNGSAIESGHPDSNF